MAFAGGTLFGVITSGCPAQHTAEPSLGRRRRNRPVDGNDVLLGELVEESKSLLDARFAQKPEGLPRLLGGAAECAHREPACRFVWHSR